MPPDVVIVTHRDLVALAPQPLHLGRALANRGLNVVLVSTSPGHVCDRLSQGSLKVISPRQWHLGGRCGMLGLYAFSLSYLLGCKLAINFDISNLWPVAFAWRIRRFVRVLYWLEPFYGDYGSTHLSYSSKLGLRSLASIVPPEALVDVNGARLQLSRELCGNPSDCFVVRNVPPESAGRDLGLSARRNGNSRMVYAGSVTGIAFEGLELLLRALGRSNANCSLTIYPAEGRAAAEDLARAVSSNGVEDKVELCDRVPRDRLSATLAEYDVGIVLYPVRPGQNINSLLAAPNKLYEYLASGLAVIASNNDTLQFVSHEGLGWNLTSADVDSVAHVLRCAQERSDVDECRKRAYEAFKERYNYETEAAPLINWICARIHQEFQQKTTKTHLGAPGPSA